MRHFLFTLVFLLCSLFTEAQTAKYFKHLVFRETPYSETKGRIPLTEKEVENVNHFKLNYDAQNRLILVPVIH